MTLIIYRMVLGFLLNLLRLLGSAVRHLPPEHWIRAHQGCILYHFLFALFTNKYASADPPILAVKFYDDTNISGLISGTEETAYRGEVQREFDRCASNDFGLNIKKTILWLILGKGMFHFSPFCLLSLMTSVEQANFVKHLKRQSPVSWAG